MTGQGHRISGPGRREQGLPLICDLAGCRYWTASLLPALVGTTLPFWLRPDGFSFRWIAAVEFLVATLLIHAGFSLLQARVMERGPVDWPGSRPSTLAALCIGAACLVGVHLNSRLPLHAGVPGAIFVVYGLTTLAAAVLYLVLPFSFWRRAGGEVVLCEGLGLMPVLGAYLVQVGDITRTVYLASLPIVVATGLWVWTDELVTRPDDEQQGRRTLVILFTPRLSGRMVAPLLSAVFYATVLAAVLTAAITPWALVALFLLGLVRRIVATSWTDFDNPGRMLTARRKAIALHFATAGIFAASSLIPTGMWP